MSRKRKKKSHRSWGTDPAVKEQRRAESERKKSIRRRQQHEYYTKQKRNKSYRSYQ